jgi:hypothetical protein
MTETSLQRQIARKGSDKEKLAQRVVRDPGLLPDLLDGLHSDRAAVKYGCAKVLRIVSETEPGLVYPYIDLFEGLLRAENKILQWEAIFVIGELARVDTDGKIEKVFNRYFAPISGPVMITAANVIAGGAKIALAKPELTTRIVNRILAVEKARYRTAECRRVAIGQAITAFDRIFDRIRNKSPVIGFVRKQLRSPRPATRKKAERFLKKHG